MREYRDPNIYINKDVRLCDDREKHCKYMLEDNIEENGGFVHCGGRSTRKRRDS